MKKNRYKVDDTFSLTVKSAGETATFDPAKIVENIYKVADIFKDISQLFSAIKVGWSVSYDFSLFQGTLNLGWGMRWPAAYKENARVWYVERYLTASGDIKLVEGSLTASVGLSFDWGWLPAGVVAEIAASLKAVVQVTPTVNIVYTNPADGLADIEREVPVKFEITFSGTATGSARAFGFSRVLKGAADAKFTASGKWALSTLRTPSLKASVKFDGLVLTGYFESSAEDPHRANMKPIKLLEPRVIMEEREFWS